MSAIIGESLQRSCFTGVYHPACLLPPPLRLSSTSFYSGSRRLRYFFIPPPRRRLFNFFRISFLTRMIVPLENGIIEIQTHSPFVHPSTLPRCSTKVAKLRLDSIGIINSRLERQRAIYVMSQSFQRE